MTIAREELSRDTTPSCAAPVLGIGRGGPALRAPRVRCCSRSSPTTNAATVDDPLRRPENLGSERDWGSRPSQTRQKRIWHVRGTTIK